MWVKEKCFPWPLSILCEHRYPFLHLLVKRRLSQAMSLFLPQPDGIHWDTRALPWLTNAAEIKGLLIQTCLLPSSNKETEFLCLHLKNKKIRTVPVFQDDFKNMKPNKANVNIKLRYQELMGTLFTTASLWDQLQCPPADEQTDKWSNCALC